MIEENTAPLDVINESRNLNDTASLLTVKERKARATIRSGPLNRIYGTMFKVALQHLTFAFIFKYHDGLAAVSNFSPSDWPLLISAPCHLTTVTSVSDLRQKNQFRIIY
ncbi:hypothetical protein GEMRC1_010516 [Eukaryota sp. GEM-RC1]